MCTNTVANMTTVTPTAPKRTVNFRATQIGGSLRYAFERPEIDLPIQ